MIGLVQRVTQASVTVDQQVIGEIGKGMLILLGVEKSDTSEQVKKMAQKLCNYRIFSDHDGKMNLNINQIGGQMLVVSQFTLVADTQKGNRPGFSRGASPEHGEALYKELIDTLGNMGQEVASGQFGADMQVALINDGPVTFNLQV